MNPHVMAISDLDFAIAELQSHFGEAPETYTAIIQHLRAVRCAVARMGPLDRQGILRHAGDLSLPELDLDGWAKVATRFSASAQLAQRLKRHGAAYWFASIIKGIATDVAANELGTK